MSPALREGTARRFPLVPRPRPCCHPLDARVRQAANLACAAARGSPDQAATTAAQAHNYAALIVSDCGLPALARDLCRRQFSIFQAARPLDAPTMELAMQPLVNLGRLRARSGDGIAAHHLITSLFSAVRHQTAVSLDGIPADFSGMTRTPGDHREIVRWLRTVLLADGTRALAQAGRWNQALRHVRDHDGIGQDLLDGRQTAIIACYAAGDARASADLLDQAPAAAAPWEAAIAASLAALTGRGIPAATLADRYLALGDDPAQVAFRARVGLTALDLADGEHHPRLAAAIEADALRAKDAYAARDALAHPACASLISAPARDALTRLVDAAGLGRGTMPPEALDQITATASAAEATLAMALAAGNQAAARTASSLRPANA